MTTIDTRVRSVLNAPRGHRFSRPGLPHSTKALPESHQERRERLLRQMRDNPRVAHMLEHGELPHWMIVARQRREQADKEAEAAKPSEEPTTTDLPGMLPFAARGRHRAPHRWRTPVALAISAALLLGHRVTETMGQVVIQSSGFPL